MSEASIRFPPEVVEEAILVLDVYASQEFWSLRRHYTRAQVVELLDVSALADELSWLAWSHVDLPLTGWNPTNGIQSALREDALEAAQMLREGWLP